MEGWTLIIVYDIGCFESTEVLGDAPSSLGCTCSLRGDQFDPHRECIDHYQDVCVALNGYKVGKTRS